MSSKTHYRKVYKSDHLGVADLEDFLEEGVLLDFTIKTVKQEIQVSVAGRKGDHNIAYFVEQIKPMVLNATNAKQVSRFNNNSTWIEDWDNTPVRLYIDENVKMKGQVVGGIRIRTSQPPKNAKTVFTINHFKAAHTKKASIDFIKKTYSMTSAIEKQYKEYVTKN